VIEVEILALRGTKRRQIGAKSTPRQLAGNANQKGRQAHQKGRQAQIIT